MKVEERAKKGSDKKVMLQKNSWNEDRKKIKFCKVKYSMGYMKW